jgi:hypothetical protein
VIEELVIDRVACLRGASDKIADDHASIPGDQAKTVKSVIRRLELGSKRVVLFIDRGSLADGMDAAQPRLRPGDTIQTEDDTYRLTIPIRLKTLGGETVIEGPNGAAPTGASHLDRNLIKAIARAFEWREQLASGKTKSFRTLARQAGCTEGYVRQIVDLAFLAPDTVSAILRGSQARHLTVDRLVRQPLPLSWSEQRRVFGLTD